jgi:hypothetical protein
MPSFEFQPGINPLPSITETYFGQRIPGIENRLAFFCNVLGLDRTNISVRQRPTWGIQTDSQGRKSPVFINKKEIEIYFPNPMQHASVGSEAKNTRKDDVGWVIGDGYVIGRNGAIQPFFDEEMLADARPFVAEVKRLQRVRRIALDDLIRDNPFALKPHGSSGGA